MKILTLLFFFLPIVLIAQDDHDHAHGGDDHGHDHGAPIQEEVPQERRILESSSHYYEAVISYGDIHGGDPVKLNLFVSDVNSNEALDSIYVQLICPEIGAENLPLSMKEVGWYECEMSFPNDGDYDFHVLINGPSGDATLVLKGLEVGGHSHDAEISHGAHWYSKWWVSFLAGVLTVLLVFVTSRRWKRTQGRTLLFAAAIAVCQPFACPNFSSAQEDDHDHGAAPNGSGFVSDDLIVPKETQFLFDILTAKVDSGTFRPAQRFFAKVVATPQGYSVIYSPQLARVSSVSVKLGQSVNKGDVLGKLELISDAASQTSLSATLIEAQANYTAAKNEVERLSKISDIVAKKDQDEAKARLEIASENIKLLESGGKRNYTLISPIDGILEEIGASIGRNVSMDDQLFVISNASEVYVEAQIFEQDRVLIQHASGFRLVCSDQSRYLDGLKLVTLSNKLNETNQAQKAVFSIQNGNGDLRIGESVSILAFEELKSDRLYVPNQALSEINGKPVIFVKESAEVFKVVYVRTGRDNGIYTEILDGLQRNQRVVVSGTYQLKMIFLNR